MANKSISQLTAGAAVSGTDIFPDVQTAGVGPVKVTATQLATFFWYQPTLVAPSLGAATATSINIGGATLGSNVLAVNGTTLLGGATTVSTGGLTIGVAGTTGGTIALKGSTAGTLTLQVPATVTDYSITLPSAAAAANGYILTSTTAGVTSWTNPTALGVDLDVGSTAITGGTTGRVLYDNAGVLGEYTAVPVGFGGTGTSTAFTAGSVVFAGASGTYTQDNANLFWDDTNNRLGIGTNGPTGQLQITATTSANNTAIIFNGSSTYYNRLYLTNAGADGIFGVEGSTANQLVSNSSAYSFNVGTIATAPLNFVTANSVRATIDASGNLGLGVTPSAWSGYGLPVLQLSNDGTIVSSNSNQYLGANLYYSSGFKYIVSQAASYYYQNAGAHKWFTAPSGTAGNAITITQAMTLDASGNLGIGATATAIGSYRVLQVNGTSGGYISLGTSGTEYANLYGDTSTGLTITAAGARSILFQTNAAERARFDSVGNLLLGGTAARGTTAGTAHLDIFNGTAPAGTLTNGISLYSSSGDFHFMTSAGDAFKVGYRNVPPVGTKTGSYSLATGDVGKYVQVGSGGSITIPDATFAEGDIISIFNNTSGNITITCTITTAYIAGTDTDKATMTLATRGVATILFISSTVCVVSGNVS